jgi:hypothetical protein
VVDAIRKFEPCSCPSTVDPDFGLFALTQKAGWQELLLVRSDTGLRRLALHLWRQSLLDKAFCDSNERRPRARDH